MKKISRMMRLCLSLLLLSTCLISERGYARKNGSLERPALVVGIVVDQMRWDYLYRYYDHFGEKGFRRLLDGGYNCQQTKLSHLPSFTAPGHAGIYTGSVPAIHGIVSNNWFDRSTGRAWYCTEDTTVMPIGGSWKAGRMSPRNLLVTTVADELKLATHFKSRVYGISIKDRGAILPVGHLADGAFWLDDSTGNFITSSFYASELPLWVQQFNKRRVADSLMALPWEMLRSPSEYYASFPNNNKYEGLLPGEEAPEFPHKANSYKSLRYLPAGNTLALQMAVACIEGEALGRRGGTDFISISLSSPDYAGHVYGPGAVELEDMYMRLDQDLAGFIRYLDKRVGKGKYVLLLTADHGAAYNAQMLQDKKVPAGNTSNNAMKTELNAYVQQHFGLDSAILSLHNYQVYLNELVCYNSETRRQIKEAVIQWLKVRKDVAFVADLENLGDCALPDPICAMIVNGYHRERGGIIQFIPPSGWYHGYLPTGSTHGLWNAYDVHIPLIWYGWGIKKGETYASVEMSDIAPTLAALLRIPQPNGCVGKVIVDLLQ